MKKLAYLMILVFVITGSFIKAQETGTKVLPANPDFRTGTLPNGLKYYIRYNKKPENKVELRLAVNAGSVLEDNDQQGLAHFMEHMNFNGLKNFPDNEIIQYLRRIGVAFGNDLNAYTGFDQTVYILPVPSKDQAKLDSAFMILSDWSAGALLTDSQIDNERGVILAESRIGKGADDRMEKIYLPVMLNGSKYANRLPIGNDSIIRSFKYDVLRRFYKDWYRPSLQAVIVVGDMPVDKAEQMIIEKFSNYKDPVPARERPVEFGIKPYDKNIAMVVSDREASSTDIMINGNPRERKPMKTEADYLARTAESLAMSMLNQRFNELSKQPDPPFIYAYARIGSMARGYENFGLSASSASNGIRKATASVITETVRVRKYGFTEAELERAKANMISAYEKRYNERDKMESSSLIREPLNNFLVGDAMPGIEWEYNFIKNNIAKITLASIEPVIKKMDIDSRYFALITAKDQPGLPSENLFMSWIDSVFKLPVQPYVEAAIPTSLLEKEPVAGKVIKKEVNEKLGTTTYHLSNNAVVCIKPTDFKNDEILLTAQRFGGYSLYKGEDFLSAQSGSAIMNEMGYGQFSVSDLQKFMAGKNASVSAGFFEATDYVMGRTVNKDLETMFRLMYLKCTSPRLDESAFKSYLKKQTASIEQMKQDPRTLFIDSSYNVLYQGNKRAHTIYPISDYMNIKPENALSFYKSRFSSANGMYYVIVGSFREEEILPLIEKYIGGLSSSEVNTKFENLGITPLKGSNEFTLRKGSEEQGMLMHYFTGTYPYNVDDDFRLTHLNLVMRNLITDEIREKMSAIYGGGVSGSLSKYPREEFVIRSSFPCGPDNMYAIDTAFMAIVTRIQKDGGITELDLKKIREPELERNKVNLKENLYWLNSLLAAHLNNTDPERIILKEQLIKDLTPGILIETARKFYSTPNIYKAQWLPETVR